MYKKILFKTLSWRMIATIITFIISFLITNDLSFSFKIGLADTIIKLIAYYLHELLWINNKNNKNNSQ